jgi:membrane associated rhomboid family serine protease
MGTMTDARFEDTAEGPPRGSPFDPEREGRRPAREPVFNAPWPAMLLVALIVGGYALQSRFPQDLVLAPLAFSSLALAEGRWWTLFSALFLHGSWAHALMNGAFGLAFGTPVSRFLGEDARGAITFFAFYLLCGALSSLGFAALHSDSPALLVGASGAVSGLMGATARLMAGHGRGLGSMFSRTVLGMGAAWLMVNLLIGLLARGVMPGAGDAAIAWEAHIAGFIAGVLVVGPFAWFARRG